MKDRSLIISIIRLKIKDLEDFCTRNGFPCRMGFSWGRSSEVTMSTNDDGVLEFIPDEDKCRTYSDLTFEVTIEDSKWGDNPKMIKMLHGLMEVMRGEFNRLLDESLNNEDLH